MIGANALSIELIKPTGERSTANLVPRSHSVFLRLFIQLRGSYLLSYLYLQFKIWFVLYISIHERRLYSQATGYKWFLWNEDFFSDWDSLNFRRLLQFDSFPPLTEGVKTTWSNRLTFRLRLRPIMYMNRSKVKRKDKKAASIRAQLIKLLQV